MTGISYLLSLRERREKLGKTVVKRYLSSIYVVVLILHKMSKVVSLLESVDFTWKQWKK